MNIKDQSISANMKKIGFYVCPVCGNVITSVGEGEFACCNMPLVKREAAKSDEEHMIHVETIDNEYYVTLDHSMTKDHYISFLAYVTSGTSEMVKLYPEQDISVRFRKKGHGMLYAYCNKHGLFKCLL